MSTEFRQYCKEQKIKMRDVGRTIRRLNRVFPLKVSDEAMAAIKEEDVKVYEAHRSRLISVLDKVVQQ